MKDIFIDVTLELPTSDLFDLPDPTRFLIERLRSEADRECEGTGASVRTDRAPEFIVNEAIDPPTGKQMTLVAARFPVVAPDILEVGQPV